MSKIKVNYLSELRTSSKHIDSNSIIETDAPKDNNGLGRKFSPTDLLASALGSCLLTIMGIVADRHNFKYDNSYANVEKIMSDNPRRISEIKVDIFFDKNLNSDDKKLLIRSSKHCPVHNSLNKDINIKINFI
jgi:uncharacterized OsmC-like protein|tara:strand:- start:2547 stop:2945 length:399 start_codon:yes stop_codon:yes gene_type:complete